MPVVLVSRDKLFEYMGENFGAEHGKPSPQGKKSHSKEKK